MPIHISCRQRLSHMAIVHNVKFCYEASKYLTQKKHYSLDYGSHRRVICQFEKPAVLRWRFTVLFLKIIT